MLQIFQESCASTKISKISQTSLYNIFNQTGDLNSNVGYELSHTKETLVPIENIRDMIYSIRLNGGANARNAVDAFMHGDISIIFNKESSKIPLVLPYLVGNNGSNGKSTAYIFADKFMSRIDNTKEAHKLTAVLEATYLSLLFAKDPNMFLSNSQLMLTLCNIYTCMATAPLENYRQIKGDHLNKMSLYFITHFYNMFRDDISEENIPYRRIIQDKMDSSVVKMIIDDVKQNDDKTTQGILELIKKINPVRYEKLPSEYVALFQRYCGIPMTFALEYMPYLFLMISAATYDAYELTTMSAAKYVKMPCKKAQTQLVSLIGSVE